MKKTAIILLLITIGMSRLQAQTCNCIELSGVLDNNDDLVKTECYELIGCVEIPNNVTIDIEEGTMIYPRANSALIVHPGGKLNAIGTSNEPIRFIPKLITDRDYGYWEGIAIGGLAENNVTGGVIELERTCPIAAGDDEEDDNSGTMSYVQIHCAVNGLSLLSVGYGTTINHVQVTHSEQNGFEFFGGAVNAYNLVSQNAKANDFTSDFGYTGNLQYLVGLRKDVNAFDAAGSNGFLIRNQGTQTNKITRPIVFNMTLFGPSTCGSPSPTDFEHAVQVMDGASAGIYNSYATDWVNYGLFLNGSTTIARTSSSLNYSYNSVNTTSFSDYSSTTWSGGCGSTMAAWIELGSSPLCSESGNEFSTLAPYNTMSVCSATPNFTISGSILDVPDYSMADYDNTVITEEDFRGAFGENVDWSDDWTDFNALATPYCEEGLTQKSKAEGYLRIIPNPSSGMTYAVFNSSVIGVATVSILDKVDGKAVKLVQTEISQTGEQKIAFDVSDLRVGIYILKVEVEGMILHQQLIVR